MHLLDINVWLALAFEVHFHHGTAKAWFEEAGPDSCAFCRLTQQGFLRLASNPAVFRDEAVTMDLAWSCYESFLDDERVYFMREPEGLEKAWKRYTRNQKYSHKIWNDAYLAAFAQTAKITVATFDQGFREYKETSLTILA